MKELDFRNGTPVEPRDNHSDEDEDDDVEEDDA